MSTDFDLDAYFRRIHYTGPRTATLDALRAIHRQHAQTIPFENLDPLLRRPVSLDPAALQAKLVHGGRGGWCFEHNQVLRHALDALGFRTTGLTARVLWNQPAGTIPSRGHMLLLVHLDGGPHVADVGFGGLTLTAPLRLVPDVEQATPHEPFRFTLADGEYLMEVRLDDAWKPVYRFDLQTQHPADYALTNWYLSNHPSSHFLHGLIAARPLPDGRLTLRNDVLTVRRHDHAPEQRTLTDVTDVRNVLTTEFDLTLPDDPALDVALARVIAPR